MRREKQGHATTDALIPLLSTADAPANSYAGVDTATDRRRRYRYMTGETGFLVVDVIGVICEFLSAKKVFQIISSQLLHLSTTDAFEELSLQSRYKILIALKNYYDRFPVIATHPDEENAFRKRFYHPYFYNPFHSNLMVTSLDTTNLFAIINKIILNRQTNENGTSITYTGTEQQSVQDFAIALSKSIEKSSALQFFPKKYPNHLFSHPVFRFLYPTVLFFLMVASLPLPVVILLITARNNANKDFQRILHNAEIENEIVNAKDHYTYMHELSKSVIIVFDGGDVDTCGMWCSDGSPAIYSYWQALNNVALPFCNPFNLQTLFELMSQCLLGSCFNETISAGRVLMDRCVRLSMFAENSTRINNYITVGCQYVDDYQNITMAPMINNLANSYSLALMIASISIPIIFTLILYINYRKNNADGVVARLLRFVTSFYSKETIEKSERLNTTTHHTSKEAIRTHFSIFSSFSDVLKNATTQKTGEHQLRIQ